MDDSSGSTVWAVGLGGASADYGLDITSVGSDRVAVMGYFSSTATFGDVVLTSKGFRDAFIAMVSVCTLLFAMH